MYIWTNKLQVHFVSSSRSFIALHSAEALFFFGNNLQKHSKSADSYLTQISNTCTQFTLIALMSEVTICLKQNRVYCRTAAFQSDRWAHESCDCRYSWHVGRSHTDFFSCIQNILSLCFWFSLQGQSHAF